MESKTNAPSFTVSLRGYDRMEVDEYLDSLAEALGQVEVAEDRNRAMQSQVDRLNSRIADLEERIRNDIPRTGAVLGERIAILLRSAEETAADTIGRAEATAAGLLEKAREDVASAEDQARGAIARGEDQARRIEAAARAEGTEIVAEAEARASARTRQIEQWAEQVISHTRAEEARMLADQQEKRERSEAELQALADQRDAVAGTIAALRESLGQALGLVGTGTGTAESDRSAGSGLGLAAGAPTEPPVSDLADMADMAGGSGVSGGAEGAGGASPTADHSGPGVEATPGENGAALDEDGSPADAGSDAEAHSDIRVLETDEEAGDRVEAEVEEQDADELPWPSAFQPTGVEADDGEAEDVTGEIIVVTGTGAAGIESDEFESKLEAWVSGSGDAQGQGPRHFRR
jgi:DivIVA domain-containing protein